MRLHDLNNFVWGGGGGEEGIKNNKYGPRGFAGGGVGGKCAPSSATFANCYRDL